jgi:hypothetical protein
MDAPPTQEGVRAAAMVIPTVVSNRRNVPKTLVGLPTEILCEIGVHLTEHHDIFNFMCTNRFFYRLLEESLYRIPTTGDKILNIIDTNNRPAFRRVFLNNCVPPNLDIRYGRQMVTPLLFAICNLELQIVRLLLLNGANTEYFFLDDGCADTAIGLLLADYGARNFSIMRTIARRRWRHAQRVRAQGSGAYIWMNYPTGLSWRKMVDI